MLHIFLFNVSLTVKISSPKQLEYFSLLEYSNFLFLDNKPLCFCQTRRLLLIYFNLNISFIIDSLTVKISGPLACITTKRVHY